MGRQLTQAFEDITRDINATEEQIKRWTAEAVNQPAHIRVVRRGPLLAAAVAATLLLAGFTYAASRYLDKVVTSDASFNQSMTPMSADEAAALLAGLKPGDVLNLEQEIAEGVKRIKAIRGDTVDYIQSALKDSNRSWIKGYPHNPVEEQADQWYRENRTVADYVAEGYFAAGLEGGGYVPKGVVEHSRGGPLIARYTGENGERIEISYFHGISVGEDVKDQIHNEEILVGERTFLYMDMDGIGSGALGKELVLHLGDDRPYANIAISGDEAVTKDQLVRAAEYLVLYNEHSNVLHHTMGSLYGPELFRRSADPLLQQHADEIAAALASAPLVEDSDAIPVWEKDGRVVSALDYGQGDPNITLEYRGTALGDTLEWLSLPKTTPLDRWIDPGTLTRASAFYAYGKVQTIAWFAGEEGPVKLNVFQMDWSGEHKTPLDALASQVARSGSTLVRVFYTDSGDPVLVSLGRPSGQTGGITLTSVKAHNGGYAGYNLSLSDEELTAQVRAELMGE